MGVERAIRERRTVGAFSSRPVLREVIERLIASAVWAPNHHLTEPWRFIVVAGAAREELAAAIESAGEAGSQEAAGVVRTARTKLLRAPALVVVGQAVADESDAVTDLEDYASCCCATQNMLLAAAAVGLGSKWSTGVLSRSPAAKAHLGLGPLDRIVGYVYLGYPAEAPVRDEERAVPSIDWRGI
jgi:nitroreductase